MVGSRHTHTTPHEWCGRPHPESTISPGYSAYSNLKRCPDRPVAAPPGSSTPCSLPLNPSSSCGRSHMSHISLDSSDSSIRSVVQQPKQDDYRLAKSVCYFIDDCGCRLSLFDRQGNRPGSLKPPFQPVARHLCHSFLRRLTQLTIVPS